ASPSQQWTRRAVWGLGSLVLLGAVAVLVAKPAAATNTYETAVKADSPAAFYLLNESSGATAADDSGNSHNATYNTGVTYGVSGGTGDTGNTAIHGDGTNTPVTGGDSFVPTGNGAWSLEGWVKSSSSSAKMLASWGDPCCNGKAVYLYMSDATH